MPKYYTIKDIAEITGFSCMTVSRVINDKGYVKKDTYEKIIRTCKELGYQPNASARNLKFQKDVLIGIMVPDISTVFNGEIVSRFEHLNYDHGYQTFISSSFNNYEREKEILQTFSRFRVSGIVALSAGTESKKTIKEYAKKIPTICMGGEAPDEGVSWVRADEIKGGRMAVEYLLGLGHKKFTFVGGRSSYTSHLERRLSFETTLKDHGINDYSVFRIDDEANGYETGKAYFREKRDATAIVAVNSKFALGFMDAANEIGLDAPKDFSIVAFNGESFPSLQRISLTTVAQPIAETTQIAFDLLMKNIEMDGMMEPVGKIIEPVLTIRKSCQRINQ